MWPLNVPYLQKDKYSSSRVLACRLICPACSSVGGYYREKWSEVEQMCYLFFTFADFWVSALDSSLISLTQQIFNQARYVKMWFLQRIDLSWVLELKCVFSPSKADLGRGRVGNQIFYDILCLSDKMFWGKSSKLEIKSLLKVILHSCQSDTLSD